MNRTSSLRLAWLLAWPALLLAADVVIRLRVLAAFAAVEWVCYVASVVLMTGLWWLLARGLVRLRRRGWRRCYWLALGLLCLGSVAVPAFGYGCYLANGDLPDLFLLSFIRCETENALILAKAAVGAWHFAGLGVGVLGLAAWTDRWRRWEDATPPPGRRALWVVALACWGALWICWSTTVSRGQAFVPVVRIPLVVAMYLYNEVKGINPKPIRLPARQPLAIGAKLPQSPVNVLVILNESLRRQNLGIHGYHRDTTPFLSAWQARHPDRFFRFERAYANSTTTLLAVPSILTGIAPVQPLDLKVRAPLLWQWAAAADMRSFFFTSHDPDWLGLGDFITTPPPDKLWDPRADGLLPYRDLGCDDHFTVDRAVRHLESLAASTKPFLGVIHLNVNHYPYNTRAEYRRWSGSDLDLYDNTILETDAHTRRLVETLERTGQLGRTVVVFASDHGEGFNEHGYSGHFYCHFVETIAVPLVLYLPAGFAAGRDLSALRQNQHATVQNLDILPTVLDCIGAWDHPAVAGFREPMMGASLFRPLEPDRTVWITNTNEAMPSVIGLSSVTGRWHYLLRTSGSPPVEDLYDLEADPEERHNLWPHTPPGERDRFRRGFLQFSVPARMMTAAFPHLLDS